MNRSLYELIFDVRNNKNKNKNKIIIIIVIIIIIYDMIL